VFAMIWRFFPGPAWLRIIVVLLVLAALVWAVVTYVYPWAATVLPAPSSGEVSVG
jgi:phage shock protein PspC (stress-responsive transcriptional regulator)